MRRVEWITRDVCHTREVGGWMGGRGSWRKHRWGEQKTKLIVTEIILQR